MSTVLPTELYIRILTHPVLLSSRENGDCSNRKRMYLSCSLTNKLFYKILHDPFTQVQWVMNYHDGSIPDVLRFLISRKWFHAIKLLFQGKWINESLQDDSNCASQNEDNDGYDIKRKRQTILNDALIFAMCQIHSTDDRKNDYTRKHVTDQSKTCTADILKYYQDDRHYYSDSEVIITHIISHYSDSDNYSCASPGAHKIISQDKASSHFTFNFDKKHSQYDDGDSSLKTVSVLLELGSNPHTMDDFSIRRAARQGIVPLVKVLLSYGANASSRNNEAFASAALHGHLDVIKILCSSKIDRSSALIALQKAAVKGNLDIVKFLLEKDTAGDSVPWKRDLMKWLIFDWEDDMFRIGNTFPYADELDMFGFHGNQSTQKEKGIMKHPLIAASQKKEHVEILKYLLERITISQTNEASVRNAINLALRVAAKEGNIDACKIMIANGADHGICLPIAAKQNHFDLLKYVIKEHYSGRTVKVSSECSSYLHPIIAAIRNAETHEMINFLIDAGNVNWKTIVSTCINKTHMFIIRQDGYTPDYMNGSSVTALIDEYAHRIDINENDFDEDGFIILRPYINSVIRRQPNNRRIDYLRSQWMRRFG